MRRLLAAEARPRTPTDGLRRLAHVLIWAPAVLLGYFNVLTAVGRRDPFPDLRVYRAGAGALGHGGAHLYTVHGSNGGPFTYPPIAAILLAPTRALSLEAAGVVMAVLTCLAAAVVAYLCVRRRSAAAATVAPAVAAAVATACAMQTVPFRTAIYFGQVGGLLLLLVSVDV